MYENVIYNRNMFYRDKLYDYKKFCERIVLVKSNCNPKPPKECPFLKTRLKKKEMEYEKKREIENCKDLLYQKYKYMYKNHGNYHPSNLKFQPHPPSLKFSQHIPQYYEMCKDNKYLGEKLKEVQSSKGYYNSEKSLSEFKKLKYIRDKRIKSSKYNNNILLNLVTPLTYEKRLFKILRGKNKRKINVKNYKPNTNDILLKASNRFNTHYSNNFSNNKNENKILKELKVENENKKPINKIKIERQAMLTD